MKIYPTLTSNSLATLKEQITLLSPFVKGFHIHYMDGNFVIEQTDNIKIINTIHACTTKQFWIHVMAYEPLDIIRQLKLKPQDRVTFHAESTKEASPIVSHLEKRSVQPSLALNPETPLHALMNTLYAIKHITLMSKDPIDSENMFLNSIWQKNNRPTNTALSPTSVHNYCH